MNKLESISVVGGGTAGFVAALILKVRFPSVRVNVIRSSKIGIVGVGEGSTEHWNEFMEFIGVHWHTIIKECDATFKCGIMFKDWGKHDYLHSIGPEQDVKNGQTTPVYAKLIGENGPRELFNPNNVWKNQVFEHFLEPGSSSPFNQYHFNTHKLNDFLTKVAQLYNIDVIDDEILNVNFKESGEIESLTGEKATYASDFYIDSTGFAKVLISKMGAKWKSHSEYLKMKSAIVFPIGDTDEYNIWTVAQAMDNGWMFKIPVWGRSGNGYIFDSDYITADQAKDEVEKFLGHEIEVGKTLNFDPGNVDKVWIKNCCAIGLSASFVEPLEASSIGTSIQQSFLLMHRLPNYNQKTIDRYNKDCEDILTNLRDFIVLHYVTKKNNTQFWRDVQTLKLPDTLQEKLEMWRKNIPIADDLHRETAYTLFKEAHHIHIMQGLDLFDRDAIYNEYQLMHQGIKDRVENYIRERRTTEMISPKVGHKEFIRRVRSMRR